MTKEGISPRLNITKNIESVLEWFEGTDPISAELSCLILGVMILGVMILDTPVLHQSKNTAKKKRGYEDSYCTVRAVKANYLLSLSPEKLSRMWGIRLKTTIKTLDATTHQCIMYTWLLANRFKTNKAQLWYKKRSCWYGKLYVDYLKVGVKSERQFIGGNLYNKKIGFKKFFPCLNGTSSENGHTLRGLIELICLSPTLHSYNHKNFKDGLFKQLLQKFGIIPIYTDPHLPWQNISEREIG